MKQLTISVSAEQGRLLEQLAQAAHIDSINKLMQEIIDCMTDEETAISDIGVSLAKILMDEIIRSRREIMREMKEDDKKIMMLRTMGDPKGNYLPE